MSTLRLSAFLVLFTLSTNVICGNGSYADKHSRSKFDGSAHENKITKKVRKFTRTITDESKKFVQCIISVADELADTFESLLCLQTGNGSPGVLTYVELGEALQRLTIHPEPPPAYTPSYCPEHLQPLNPVLWERLGLDSLPVISRCINGITSHYSVSVDVLKNKLTHQDSSLELPYVDVHLPDISGNSFSLSELPFEWLQSPEIVDHLEGISPANKEYRLRRVTNGISLARQLANAITTKASLKQLQNSARRARSAAGNLNSFRCEEMDFIGWSISQDGRDEAMECLYDHCGIEPKEQHLVISIGKRERGSNATYRLYATLSRLQRLRKKASDIVTPSGNLMAWALGG